MTKIHTHTVGGVPLLKEGTIVQTKSEFGFYIVGRIRGYTRIGEYSDLYIIELVVPLSINGYSNYCVMPIMLEEIKK